jgi:hypothetical protein
MSHEPGGGKKGKREAAEKEDEENGRRALAWVAVGTESNSTRACTPRFRTMTIFSGAAPTLLQIVLIMSHVIGNLRGKSANVGGEWAALQRRAPRPPRVTSRTGRLLLATRRRTHRGSCFGGAGGNAALLCGHGTTHDIRHTAHGTLTTRSGSS